MKYFIGALAAVAIIVAVLIVRQHGDSIDAKGSLHPWLFPGPHARRLPIVANNIVKLLYDRPADGTSVPSVDTLYHFFREAASASFTLVIVDFTPMVSGVERDQYYENAFAALNKVNRERPNAPLQILVYDGRLKNPVDPHVAATLKRSYLRPEVYGLYADEPRARDFPRLSEWCRIVSTEDSEWVAGRKLFYVNLFGAAALNDYPNYVNNWIDQGRPQVLSFDNYAPWDDERAASFGDAIGSDWARDYFYNLEVFRQASLRTGLPFWTWILVHRHWSTYSKRYYRRASPADLRFQIYSALAYGAKGILYYRFWNPPLKYNQNGWHEEEAVLDNGGRETELYAPISGLNAEVLSIGDLMLELRNVGVYHVTNDYPVAQGVLHESPGERLYSPTSSQPLETYGIKQVLLNGPPELSELESRHKIVTEITNPAAMIGIFERPSAGSCFLLLVNKNRRGKEEFHLTLDGRKLQGPSDNVRLRNTRTSVVLKPRLVTPGNPMFDIEMQPGDGLLFSVEYER